MSRKEYLKQWRKNNQEHCKEWNKKAYEKRKEYFKERYENNKEHIDKLSKEYKQTDAGKKSHLISAWKQKGLMCDNINELYEHYINTFECENCGVELVTGNTAPNRRCMDHCHITGKFRNILCHTCNIERGYDDRSNLPRDYQFLARDQH